MQRRLRVITVDDEPLALEGLRMSLQPHPDVELVAQCKNGQQAVEAIRTLDADLVYLDVQMPGLDGFGVIAQVGPACMPAVIFVTAYEEHALRAFAVHAIDYLLKPVDEARFHESLAHARRRLGNHPAPGDDLGQRLLALLAERGLQISAAQEPTPAAADPPPHPQSKGPARWITVVEHQTRQYIRIDDVDWFEAEGNYVRVQVGPKSHLVRISLTQLLQRLDPARFVRIHRSVVVNLLRVRTVEPWEGGDYLAILHDGRELRVSRTYKDALLGPLL